MLDSLEPDSDANRTFSLWRHFTTTTSQNPTGFCLVMLIRVIVLCCPLGIQNLNLKRMKNEFW